MSTFDLPWGAWHRDEMHSLVLPDHWTVDVLAPADATRWTALEMDAAFDAPVEAQPLAEQLRGRRSCCIVVDDLARPTPAACILPLVLGRMHSAGLGPEDIRIVVATGSHGMLDRRQLAWKVGEDVAARYSVSCHSCRGPLAATGIMYGERELQINQAFFQADYKLTIGSVLPHAFAGYSGGAKMVLPGLADLNATARSHKFVQMGLRGGSDPNRNRFRLEAEDLARKLGLNSAVNVVTNSRRQVAAVVFGDLVASHRRACAIADDVFRTPVNRTYDCLVINAYPKDIDLLQAENAFVVLKNARTPVVTEGGVIVLASAASEGLGRHGLFEPGGLNYQRPTERRSLGGRELWLYVPTVPADAIRQLYWEGYPVFHRPQDLEEALHRRFPEKVTAAIFPSAPMQQIHDLRDSAIRAA